VVGKISEFSKSHSVTQFSLKLKSRWNLKRQELGSAESRTFSTSGFLLTRSVSEFSRSFW
jgi:hypothetical protein